MWKNGWTFSFLNISFQNVKRHALRCDLHFGWLHFGAQFLEDFIFVAYIFEKT